ncbi:DUF1707 and DUF4190 domain-containing protein [Streptacidiphilus sp. N1-12]|uniref:DUF1707 and DUF4190 domain-containing protein n=2 Tax=Streptacidiphilus alkalitolerans TaxID=3342712 RepID=A0ABV6WCQ7_9ACTN
MSTNQPPRHPVQPWQDGVPLAKQAADPLPAHPLPAQPTVDEVATMRASHADRERTVDVLKSAFAEGRLTSEEYNGRVDQVYRAQTYGELAGIVHDLPSGPMPTPYLAPGPVVPVPFAAYPPPYQQQVYGGPQPYIYATPAPGPYGYGYTRPYDRYGNPFAPPVAYRRPKNGLAVASLVLALTEFVTLGATAVPALICGHVAKSQLRRRDEEGDGMATAGIVLGWLGVAFWFLVIFVSAASGAQGG